MAHGVVSLSAIFRQLWEAKRTPASRPRGDLYLFHAPGVTSTEGKSVTPTSECSSCQYASVPWAQHDVSRPRPSSSFVSGYWDRRSQQPGEMQIRERDTWIGWHPDTFLPRIEENPTDVFARWLVDLIDTGIGELFVDDLLEDGVLNVRNIVDPDDMAIDRLFKESEQQRRLHHRYVRSRDHKKARKGLPETEYWGARARTHLFRSKRALALALT